MDDDITEWFATIGEHWAHYLERDVPATAPNVQVMSMKNAFAAGAISGLQLALRAQRDGSSIAQHVIDIKQLEASKP